MHKCMQTHTSFVLTDDNWSRPGERYNITLAEQQYTESHSQAEVLEEKLIISSHTFLVLMQATLFIGTLHYPLLL